MKKIVLIVLSALLLGGVASGQNILRNLGERAKNAVENKVGEKVENAVNNAIDKATGKKGNENTASDGKDREETAPTVSEETVDFEEIKAKSDFQRGSAVFFEDSFAGEKMGEFPSRWDLLGGSEVEVVNIKSVPALKFEESKVQPLMEEKDYLPEEFTIEFDVLTQPAEEGSSWDATLDFIFEAENGERVYDLRLSPETHTLNNPSGGYYGISWDWGSKAPGGNEISGEVKTSEIAKVLKKNDWNHIAFSFNKRALKVYLNYYRIVNIPNQKQPRSWWVEGSSDSNKGIFIRNVVMAKGAVELYGRNATDYSSAVEKAIEETGKFVTNNILFETGKATLKPESMEEIQKVADYMKKNPSARFEVQGHTDNQGSDAVNDPLSQQRAEAVVKALEEQGVDPFNLRPVGKGSHEPVADNGTDAGRAKNRRVEFIKR